MSRNGGRRRNTRGEKSCAGAESEGGGGGKARKVYALFLVLADSMQEGETVLCVW